MQDISLKYGAKISGKKSLEALRQYLKVADAEKYLCKYQLLDPGLILSLFSPEVRREIDTGRHTRRMIGQYNNFEQEDKLNKLLYLDVKTSLVDEMLVKCDRMTMINGIEGRVPFLDHRLVELAFSIPSSFKKNDQFGKLPLRKILAKRLSSDLAYRTKTGFNSPLKKWLQDDRDTAVFASAHLKGMDQYAFFDKNVVKNYAGAVKETDPALIFSLICLNSYLNNSLAKTL